MLLKGKSALITGAASGIGRAAAIAFAREGACLTLSDIDAAGGKETLARVLGAGGEAIFRRADLTVAEEVAALVASAVGKWGPLHVAFNNAGHPGGSTDAVGCTEDEWDSVNAINVKAVWLCMKHEIPEMVKAGGGAIVNTSSGLGAFAAPRSAAYVTSKHAVIGLTRSAAVDFGPHKIRVNALLPGATATPMLEAAAAGSGVSIDALGQRMPLRRVGTPDEQAEMALWLCSDSASFVSGLSAIVDGGLAVLR